MKDYLEIDSMSVSRLTNAEFRSYMSRVRNIIPMDGENEGDSGYPEIQSVLNEAAGASAIGLSAELVAEFDDYLSQMLEATRETQSSTATESLKELDSQRDDAARYLLNKVSTSVKSPVASERELALPLWNAIKVYSGIANETVQEETQLVYGMLFDMSKAEFSEAVTTLGLQPAMDELQRLNAEYEQLVAERDSANTEASKRTKTTEIRAKLAELFEEICDRAFANNLVNPTDESKQFIYALNNLTADAKARKNRRASRGDKEDVSDDDSATGDETPGDDADDRPVVD